jgi:glycosyltransferase involved in cell wall biosynthesis
MGAHTAMASNNASFAVAGGQRRVLLGNALQFLYGHETHLLKLMPRSYQAQIAIVRRLLARADLIVVPCSAMANRVAHHVPACRDRIAVRHHPVTSVGDRATTDSPFLLMPVLPAPYKNLVPQLRALLDAMAIAGSGIPVRITALPADLPDYIAHHPLVTTLGTLSHERLIELWRTATAAFFPSTLEAFGYPLAEARVYGVPVLAPDTEQAREIAGPALLPYDPSRADSLVAALERVHEPVPAEPHAFSRHAYFSWLLQVPQKLPIRAVSCTNEHKDGRDELFSQ